MIIINGNYTKPNITQSLQDAAPEQSPSMNELTILQPVNATFLKNILSATAAICYSSN